MTPICNTDIKIVRMGGEGKGSPHHLEKLCEERWKMDPSLIKLKGELIYDTQYAAVQVRLHA